MAQSALAAGRQWEYDLENRDFGSILLIWPYDHTLLHEFWPHDFSENGIACTIDRGLDHLRGVIWLNKRHRSRATRKLRQITPRNRSRDAGQRYGQDDIPWLWVEICAVCATLG